MKNTYFSFTTSLQFATNFLRFVINIPPLYNTVQHDLQIFLISIPGVSCAKF